jgi:TonB family protein
MMKIVLRAVEIAILLSSAVLLAQNAPDNAQPLHPSHGILEVLSDTKGINFAPYLEEVVHATQQNWRTITMDSSRYRLTGPVEVVVEFSIRRDGSVDGLKLDAASGNAALDRAAREAVTDSSPLLPLPEEFPEQHIELRIHFHQNSSNDASGNCGDSASHPGGSGDCPAMETNGIYRPGSHGISNPKTIYAPPPEYGEKSSKAKVQGTVTLGIVVAPEGIAHDITIEKSLNPELDRKAIETIRKWKFAPAMKDGQPVSARALVELSFHLY